MGCRSTDAPHMAAHHSRRRGRSILAVFFACLAALVFLLGAASWMMPAARSRYQLRFESAAATTEVGGAATAVPAAARASASASVGVAMAGMALAAVTLASRMRTRRFAAVENTDQETARDLDGSIWDVMSNTDAYIEADRRRRRPVFGYDDWKRHRSADREFRNLLSLPFSTTARANWKEVLAVTLVSVAVCVWNDADVSAQAASILGYYADISLDDTTVGMLRDRPTLALPALPFTLSTASLSLLLVFRTNKSYDRWWEARCVWGSIINTCRDVVRQSIVRIDPADVAVKEEITRLVSAYPRSLIYHLGERTALSDAILEEKYRDVLTNEETERLLRCTHKPMTVTGMLSDAIHRAGLPAIDEMKIDADITKFSDYYGMCERIFKTPMPLSFTRLTSRFLSVWMLCLPLALYDVAPGWLVVPIAAVVAFFIFGIEEIGVQIEEPFSVLAMSAMADGIDASIFEALKLEKRSAAVRDFALAAPAGSATSAAAAARGRQSQTEIQEQQHGESRSADGHLRAFLLEARACPPRQDQSTQVEPVDFRDQSTQVGPGDFQDQQTLVDLSDLTIISASGRMRVGEAEDSATAQAQPAASAEGGLPKAAVQSHPPHQHRRHILEEDERDPRVLRSRGDLRGFLLEGWEQACATVDGSVVVLERDGQLRTFLLEPRSGRRGHGAAPVGDADTIPEPEEEMWTHSELSDLAISADGRLRVQETPTPACSQEPSAASGPEPAQAPPRHSPTQRDVKVATPSAGRAAPISERLTPIAPGRTAGASGHLHDFLLAPNEGWQKFGATAPRAAPVNVAVLEREEEEEEKLVQELSYLHNELSYLRERGSHTPAPTRSAALAPVAAPAPVAARDRVVGQELNSEGYPHYWPVHLVPREAVAQHYVYPDYWPPHLVPEQ